MPPLIVWETDAELVYAFDLPGLSEEQIQIEVQDDTLTVSGERVRETREEGAFLPLRAANRQFCPCCWPAGRSGGVEDLGSYENGVLEVRVPKPEEAKPRRIQLGTAHADLEAAKN